MDYRIEKDTMGEVKVPAGVYWGAQTERSRNNFKIGPEASMPKEIIHAFGYLKKAAAQANHQLGVLSKEKLDLISKVCVEEDYQIIEGKKFRKKSGWRKIATFFNLSIEIVEEKYEKIGRTIVWHFTIKAIASNGRSAIGTGSCDAFERATLVNGQYLDKYSKIAKPNSIHNIRSTAETRATNRAISNLVGGGEVSYEEVV